MDAVSLLRGFYLLAAASILLAYSVPPVRTRFFDYGPRASKTATKESGRRPKAEGSNASRRDVKAGDPIAALLDHFAGYRVPHGWFVHFYLLSVCLSGFWAYQIFNRGRLFQVLATNSGIEAAENSMLTDKVVLTWCLMLIQGLRRLLECVILAKRSPSQMWIGHWVLGLLFYAFMSVSVWIEGSPALLKRSRPSTNLKDYTEILSANILPSMLFIFAAGTQYRAHRHLASLPAGPNYTLPTDLVFNRTVTPHYFAECLVYLALSLLAAPEGQMFNKTIASALVFELINLGITASETHSWYERQFGAERVKSRARMIPGVW